MNETQGGINLGGSAGSVSSNLSMLTMIRFDLRLSFCFDRLLVTVLSDCAGSYSADKSVLRWSLRGQFCFE